MRFVIVKIEVIIRWNGIFGLDCCVERMFSTENQIFQIFYSSRVRRERVRIDLMILQSTSSWIVLDKNSIVSFHGGRIFTANKNKSNTKKSIWHLHECTIYFGFRFFNMFKYTIHLHTYICCFSHSKSILRWSAVEVV